MAFTSYIAPVFYLILSLNTLLIIKGFNSFLDLIFLIKIILSNFLRFFWLRAIKLCNGNKWINVLITEGHYLR